MKFDIVLITTGSRPRLLEQSVRSLRENAAAWKQHHLTLVMDGYSVMAACQKAGTVPHRLILNTERQGASRSRNIGAASTPKYLRGDAVMFLDDDVYCCWHWDKRLSEILSGVKNHVLSGHAHPFNHTYLDTFTFIETSARITNVLSTVHITCPWSIWDDVGCFTEPGGPGGSEDVDWCSRASKRSIYGLAVTEPQCIIHTGIGSTSGSRLIGWEHVMENNRSLEKIHGVQGRVIYE